MSANVNPTIDLLCVELETEKIDNPGGDLSAALDADSSGFWSEFKPVALDTEDVVATAIGFPIQTVCAI